MSELDAVDGGGVDTLSPDSELDLTNEGFQVARTIWTITEAELVSLDDSGAGTDPFEPGAGRIRAELQFTTVVDEIEFQVTMREWFRHPTEKAQQIGLGNIKRLFIAALGAPKGSISGLLGTTVSAEGYEDKNGFRRVGRFRSVGGGSEGSAPTIAVPQAATAVAGI